LGALGDSSRFHFRSQPRKSTTSVFRHIQAGKQRKSASASSGLSSSLSPRTQRFTR
jgi:hypothetical protein